MVRGSNLNEAPVALCYRPHSEEMWEVNVFTGVCPFTMRVIPQCQVLSQVSDPRSPKIKVLRRKNLGP